MAPFLWQLLSFFLQTVIKDAVTKIDWDVVKNDFLALLQKIHGSGPIAAQLHVISSHAIDIFGKNYDDKEAQKLASQTDDAWGQACFNKAQLDYPLAMAAKLAAACV